MNRLTMKSVEGNRVTLIRTKSKVSNIVILDLSRTMYGANKSRIQMFTHIKWNARYIIGSTVTK